MVVAMSVMMLAGLSLGLMAGASVLLLVAAVCGWRPGWPTAAFRSRDLRPVMRRLLLGLVVGLLVTVASRWPVAGATVAAVIVVWPLMFGGGRDARDELERLDALTVWTESMRDSIAGSAGLEDAIGGSVATAPPALVPALNRLTGLMRAHVSLPDALMAFADEFDDAAADLVIAVLILNSRLRGSGLVATLSALATSAREGVEMRRRIEEGRKAQRRSALIVVFSVLGFSTMVTLFAADFMAPYATVEGQFVLLFVVAVFAAGLMWMRQAAKIESPPRFLTEQSRVHRALRGPGSVMVGEPT